MESKGGSDQWLSLIAGLGMFLIAATEVCADVIDANKFTLSEPVLKRGANDFELTINGKFTDEPTSSVFPNHTNAKGVAMVTFSGADLADGGSHNVKFKSDGFNPNPTGQFTLNGEATGGKVQSFALNGKQVSFVPSTPSGFDLSLALSNDFSFGLTGNVNVVVNQGFVDHFNLDEFDTLRNPRSILTTQNFSLAPGQSIPLAAHLNSADEYLLVQGGLNSNGAVVPFELAFGGPPAVPEPSTFFLFVSGLAGLGIFRRGIKRRSWT